MAISNENVTETFFNFTLLCCKSCNCLQLQNLVDPSILYSDLYTNATFSSSWEHHNIELTNFILNNTTDTSFLEIGANKGGLYKMLKNKQNNIRYNVLDMYKNNELDENIHFFEGNCETFDFTGFNALILSHVFEHLYSPLTFIQNVRNSNVHTLFISIPNFDYLLNEESITLLHSQHTFFCGLDYILYMFSLYQYKCESHFEYPGNFKSRMFKFVLDANVVPLSMPSRDIELYKKIYITKMYNLRNTQIPENSYIFPSGIYGQYAYYFSKYKNNVLGFLDNNPERHNKKLYGTDKLVYSPLTIERENITICICDCPYKEEIITGLKRISPDLNLLRIA